MRGGDVAWVSERDRGRGVSVSVRGSGFGDSKSSVHLSVHRNGDVSTAAVVGASAGAATAESAVVAERAGASRGSDCRSSDCGSGSVWERPEGGRRPRGRERGRQTWV